MANSGDDRVSTLLVGAAAEQSRQRDYDVIVIGAGVIGCCTARELARYQQTILVLEGGLDIACGSTRANSGIVHTGYDPIPGTLKARYNVAGAQMFPAWQRDLGFAYYKNGALVLAFDDEGLGKLAELQRRARENGAPETDIIDQAELRALEPAISPQAVGALEVPDSGVCDPYGLAFAAAENAADNGVEFRFGAQVVDVAKREGGYVLVDQKGRTYCARAVVNAAGIHSDEINNLVSDVKLAIAPTRGEYHLFENTLHAFSHTMFQVPTAAGKGVLVGTVAFGNMFCGPTSQRQESKTDVATTQKGLDDVMEKASLTWPDAKKGTVISNFAGLRATNADTGDFVIGPAPDAPGFFNAACIDSPGLASAPAIASDLATQVAGYLGSAKNTDFNPRRVPAPLLFALSDEQVAQLVADDPRYAHEVCKCCHVTEGELVAALHRPLPVCCLDALKWRTGATMGPCQGGRCTAKIVKIILDELGDAAADALKRFEGSALVTAEGCQPTQNYALAEGTFERPRTYWRIPGTRPAGVYSAVCTMELMDTLGRLPGKNAVIWGDTEVAHACCEKLQAAGAAVTMVSPREQKLTGIQGSPRVQAAEFTAPDGGISRLCCDLLVVSAELAHD